VKKVRRTGAIVECTNCGQKVIPSASGICPSCNRPLSAAGPRVPARTSPTSAAVFSPRQIFFLSFFSGYPTGLALASINWTRMGMTGTAVVHWVAGVILLTIWSYAIFNASCGAWMGAALQVGFCVYLARQMKETIGRFELEGNTVLPSSWKSGCLVSIITLLVLTVASFLLLLVFTSGK
jgi:hypothetical protein